MRLRETPVQIDGALPLTTRELIMDLNYLYHRRGKSLLMAAQASCEAARNAHLGLARGYVARIAALRAGTDARAA